MGARVSTLSAARLLIEALRLDHDPLDLIRRRAFAALELGVGGFLLFGGEAGTVADLLDELRGAAGRPLWLAADLERGAGQQFAGCTSLPPPGALAHHPDARTAVREAARITGAEARQLGLNWVLAPVLDLDLEAGNPIVGTRSFGHDPDQVARLGRSWIQACQTAGPAACAKHFPGHGRTLEDSHLELPVVSASAEQLEADLVPFAAAAPVVETIMAAHVAYPALAAAAGETGAEKALPASKRAALLENLLRRRLGFAGLVVSDALTMRGFSKPEEEGLAAVAAVRAGCDLLLYPADAARTARLLQGAAEAESDIAERIDAASSLSAALLEKREATAAHEPAEPRIPTRSLADDTVIAWPTAAEALAGLGGRANRLPRPDRPLSVRVFCDDADRPAVKEPGRAFAETLRSLGWDARVGDPRAKWADAAPKQAESARVVLVLSSPQAFKGRAGLSPEVSAAVGRELATGGVLVVLGHPRLLRSIGTPGVCAWSAEPLMERAAARWLARAASESTSGGGPTARPSPSA